MTENPTTITAQPGDPFIEVIRDFDATPARLFRAHTDPDLVTRWLGPREVEMRLIAYDARPGGAYRYLNILPECRKKFQEAADGEASGTVSH